MDFAADFVDQASLAAVFVVETEVGQRQFELAAESAGGEVVFGGNQAVDQFGGQRFAALVVTGYQRQHFFVPHPVFQHLAGEFDGIPRHAVDAGYGGHVDDAEHLVQAVAEFVEQGNGFVVQQQVGIAGGLAEIANDKGHRFFQAAVGLFVAALPAELPGAAAFVFAGEQVEVERGGVAFVFVVNLKKAHFGMPNRHAFFLAHADAVQALGDGKQAGEHFFQREIRAQAFFIDGVALGFLFFGVIGHVPRFELLQAVCFAGVAAQLVGFLEQLLVALLFQAVEKAQNLLRRFGHAGGERVFGVAAVAQQPRFLQPQLENFVDHRRVVPFAASSAAGVGAVELGAQAAVAAVGHDGGVGGVV